jgi:hypothetical protein
MLHSIVEPYKEVLIRLEEDVADVKDPFLTCNAGKQDITDAIQLVDLLQTRVKAQEEEIRTLQLLNAALSKPFYDISGNRIFDLNHIHAICEGYESGFGHGLALDGLDLSKITHADPEVGAAYQYGYGCGVEANVGTTLKTN